VAGGRHHLLTMADALACVHTVGAGISSRVTDNDAPIHISHIDHIVFTVADIDATIAFYRRVLGMEVVTFAGGRRALRFGQNKINLHQAGHEFKPHAGRPVPGSEDLCLITSTPLDEVIARLGSAGVRIEEGPVSRTGATGQILSVYFRDPDDNLIEVSTYDAV
jgi:catechol 2,3-dioxygenase-like lactoylglutathione lyase family enzyme